VLVDLLTRQYDAFRLVEATQREQRFGGAVPGYRDLVLTRSTLLFAGNGRLGQSESIVPPAKRDRGVDPSGEDSFADTPRKRPLIVIHFFGEGPHIVEHLL